MNVLSSAWDLLRRLAKILPLLFTVSACAELGIDLFQRQTTPAYFQPPIVSTVKPVVLTTPTHALPATPTTISVPTPSCTNNLTFLEDLTIPDGTVVFSGEAMDKRWLVSNSGTCNWDDQYRLKLIAGPDLGLPIEQSLFPARSGSQATIRLVFTAPEEQGSQRSAWQAFSPEDETFGDPIFIDVIVQPPIISP